jgi:Ca2+:H+ antiporter
MLSNLLLVLGMSFFLGGVNRLEQFFNVTVAQTAASLLALCIASLIIPTVFHNMIAEDNIVAGDAEKNQELVSEPSAEHDSKLTRYSPVEPL